MNVSIIRLYNQHLLGEKLKSATEAVEHLGAVQSQDYPAAKWALGLRIKNSTDEQIEKEFNEGKILRTHVMRPTWHFIPPEDLIWMQKLTAPNVKRLMGHYNKKLELDDELFKKTNNLIVKTLENKQFKTRQELKKILIEKLKLKTDVQRLAHIIMWAELDGLVASGPRRGKQFTYALVAECASKQKKLSREESLATLATKYFTSHGPAQLKDLSWWSGLLVKDSNEALNLVKGKLTSETVNGKVYWFDPNGKQNTAEQDSAFLLSIYDEYTIAYRDRSDISVESYIEKFIKMGNALTAVLILNGKAVGTWKRKINKNSVDLTLTPLTKFAGKELEAINKAAQEYGDFLKLETKISLT